MAMRMRIPHKVDTWHAGFGKERIGNRIMPVIIKEMRIRTVVEKRIITEMEITEEIIRKIEDRVLGRLSAAENGQLAPQRWQRKKNER